MSFNQIAKNKTPEQCNAIDPRETSENHQLKPLISSPHYAQIFWKSNLQLNLNKNQPNFVSLQQLQDPIQSFLLKEHRVVMLHEVINLRNELQDYEQWNAFSESKWTQISGQHFAQIFLQDLVQVYTFTYWEAYDFKALLQRRKDWKKLYQQLFEHVDRNLYWQMTYLFYLSAKLLPQIQTSIRLTWQQLQAGLDKYLEGNLKNLKMKLTHTGVIENVEIRYKKIMLTIIFLLNGIFINKFYNKNHLISELKYPKNKQKWKKAVLFKNRLQAHQFFLIQQNKQGKKQKSSSI